MRWVIERRLGKMFSPLRGVCSALLNAVSPEPAGRLARLVQPLLSSRLYIRRAGDRQLAGTIGSTSFDHMYRLLCSIDSDPSQTVLQGEAGVSRCFIGTFRRP